MARTFIFSLLVTYFNISTCDYAYFIYQLHPNDNELLDKGTNCRFFHNYGKHENLVALNLSLGSYKGLQEFVARMTCIYKNNGAVSCVGGNFLFFWSLYLPINIPPAPLCTTRYTRYFDTKLHGILPWADINRNCNTFFPELVYVKRYSLDMRLVL